MTRHYYAAQSPRGFANEVDVCRFGSKAERDAYAAADHWDVGTEAITARDARRILARKDNDLTQQYNRLLEWDAVDGAWREVWPA
jgi:hypothetical protein